MLIINIIETITAIVIILIAKLLGTIDILYFLDRIDFILITLWCSSMFIYVYNVSVEKIDKRVINFVFILDIFFSFLLLIASFLWMGLK